MLTDIPLEDMTEEALYSALLLAEEDIKWSDGQGIDWFNANKRWEAIREEAIKRGYVKPDEDEDEK